MLLSNVFWLALLMASLAGAIVLAIGVCIEVWPCVRSVLARILKVE